MAVTVEAISEAIETLCSGLENRGITVAPASALASARITLQRWRLHQEPPTGPDFRLPFNNAVEVGDFALRFMERPDLVDRFRGGLRNLATARSASDSMTSDQNDDASHCLLELRIALAAATFSTDPALAEPDVTFRYGSRSRLALVACKVLHGQRGAPNGLTLRDRILEGMAQIRRAAPSPSRDEVLGLVVVSLRNHMDHDSYMPLVGADRIRNLNVAEVEDGFDRDADAIRAVLYGDAGHGEPIAADLANAVNELWREHGIGGGLAFYQGTCFSPAGVHAPSAVRRLWSWAMPDPDLLDLLHAGIQYPGAEPTPT